MPASSTAAELANAAYVLGWVAVLLGLLAGIPAIICGHVALQRASQDWIPDAVKRRARIGLALGYILSFLWLALIILIIVIGMRS
jgi:hypothetical protein